MGKEGLRRRHSGGEVATGEGFNHGCTRIDTDIEQEGTEDTEEDGSSEGETEKDRAEIGKLRLRKSDCESLKG